MARRKKKPVLKTAGQGPRVVAVFGPPASGVTTLLEVLKEASEVPIAIVPYVGPNSLRQAEEALQTNEVVFLDVDGGAFFASDVQGLVDSGLVHGGSGAVVRIAASDDDCLARAAERPDYVTLPDLVQWAASLEPLEEAIRIHTLKYFMVPNDDLFEGAKALALRVGLAR